MVESGRRYRCRIISAFSSVCLAEVRIEKHSMQIIATDGENVQPIPVDAITMASGNIYYINIKFWFKLRKLSTKIYDINQFRNS